VFVHESINQYNETLGRLKVDVDAAHALVDEGLEQLKLSASEGRVISKLELSPIHERYLVLRLLDVCDKEGIPQAKDTCAKEEPRTLKATGTRERLEVELWEEIQNAAQKTGWFGRGKDALYQVRDEAQSAMTAAARATKRFLEARVRLEQLRS